MAHYDILIVGGGHGGAQTAIALRQLGFKGSVAIATNEAELPYERPPLSKEYLAGEKSFERILIRPPNFWVERNITFLTNCHISKILADEHRAGSEDGREFSYRHLVWAAGGQVRRLKCDGSDLKGVHSIRSRADVDQLKSELPQARRIAVIGGGYIGLEAAAIFRKLQKDIVIIEAMDCLLARVAGEPISYFFRREHEAKGVEIRTGETVAAIEGVSGRVSGVRLASGEHISADLVIVGIGIDPTVEPLAEAGAKASDGIEVDAFCRTSLPDIFAIGDCAAHENRFATGARIRIESVQNATDQAMIAARALIGAPVPYEAVPWFWSNQYDLRLQTVGISRGFDDMIIRGSPESRSFSVVYLRQGQVVALDCVNLTRDYAQGRKLVEAGATPDRSRLSDPHVPLKELVSG